MYLVKIGVQIAIRPTCAFQKIPPEELGGKLHPHFPINRGRCEEKNCSALLVIRESLEISGKNWFREEYPSRGASVTFPWGFSRRFSTVLRRSLFVHHRSSVFNGYVSKSSFSIHSMYPWWSPFVFTCFLFSFYLLSVPPFDVL